MSHLRNSSDTLFALEVSIRRAGNNPIYCGCKGVGQTTLLLAIGKISAILLRFIIPIYWTYETSESMPSLKHLLSEATKEFNDGRNPDMNLPFAHLEINALPSATTISDRDLRPVFLLDKFTCLYHMNNGRDGNEIVREILICGKERNSATVILAASTTCIENFVFPMSSHGNTNYPDLNNSVLMKKTIRPIRDAEELSKYCGVRFPDWEITGKEVLHKTGGVGRFISDYYTSQISWEPQSILEDVLASPPLFAMCIAILSNFNHTAHSGPWPTFGMSILEAKKVLMESCKMSDFDAVAQINRWNDSLVFYEDEFSVIGFLIPQQASAINDLICSQRDLQMICTLSRTLYGYRGGSKGKENEDFLFPFIQKSMKLEDCQDGPLTLSDEYAHFDENRCDDINQLCDMLIEWKNEVGIDRFWLSEVVEGHYAINVLQVKTGTLQSKITGGVSESQRALKHPSRMSSSSVAGILAKAEIGFATLAVGLHRCFPDAKLQFGTLSVYCTRQVEKGTEDFKRSHSSNTEYYDLQGKSLEDVKDIVEGVAQFSWKILGTESSWLQDTLPTDICSKLFPCT